MKKYKKKYLIEIIFLLIITIASKSHADVGSFESYDSGSSWSSDSSWSSYDYSSSDYSSSDYSSSGESSPLDVLISFLIFGGIFLVVYKMTSFKDKHKKEPIAKSNIKIRSQEDIEKEIRSIDENFNKEEFIAWAKNLFIKLQLAWTKRDWEEIRLFETAELYEQHKTQLQGYIDNGTINVMDRICVNYADLIDFEQFGNKDIIKIRLNSSMIDYIKDEKTGAIIKGNTSTRLTNTYKLTFIREKGTKTPIGGPQINAINCPNCGAPTQITSVGKCEYCGSLITTKDHGWVLSNLERY